MTRRVVLAVSVLVGFVGRAPAREPLPTDVEVRGAVARALPFVEQDGVAWIKKRDCMSCHVVTFMLWAHAEAKAHGVRVSEEKVTGWAEWSMKKSEAARVFFKLDEKAIPTIPEALRPKLGGLVGEGFTHEAEYVAALAKAIPADDLKRHQPELVTKATVTRGAANDGGGLDTMAQLLLARGPAAVHEKTAFYDGIADLIVRLQERDGTWKAGGQLPSRRWSRPTADQTTTLWTILALTAYQDARPAVAASVEKAHAAVKTPAGDGNFEWLAVRLLYEKSFATPDQFAARKKQLLDRQNTDGGWSVSAGGKSDAFSTGQALYALRGVGVGHDATAIRRGQRYLLGTQRPDGSWDVDAALTSNGDDGRLKRLEPIWRNWGSSWATIGLAKSLPAP